MRILSVDFGTSALKMTVMDESGAFLRSVRSAYEYEAEDMRIQIDAETIYTAFQQACSQLGPECLQAVDALAMCVFSPCLIAMNREGDPLYPAIIHIDRRSYEQADRALNAIGKETFHRISGNLPFPGGISCTSIMWLSDNHPELYKKVYKFGHLNTFLHKRLVDEWIIDPTNASFTGLYETLEEGGWSEVICTGCGISRGALPDIRPCLSLAGHLTRRGAADTGLRQGIPVIVGSNDSSSASFGADAVDTGDVLNISGSNEIMNVTVDKPLPNEAYYIRTSVEEGKWLYLSITTGGFAIEWFRAVFCAEMSKDQFYGEYLKSVVQRTPRPDVAFAPHLAGDRHSLERRKAAFSGLTLDTGRDDMLLALLVGSYEPLLRLIEHSSLQFSLNRNISWTGGLTSESYRLFKNRIFKGFSFVWKVECSTQGNFKQVKRALQF
jgi:xylulokinase